MDKPWTQSLPSRDVNAATQLAEASWRRDKLFVAIPHLVASSNTSMEGFLISALAMAILCFWPPDTVTPLSPSTVL